MNGRLDGSPAAGLPETASPKEPARRWTALVLAGLGALVLVFLTLSLLRAWDFSPGEEVSGGLESIVVSAEESPYLPPDVERFGRRPDALYVYVVGRRIGSGEGIEARVERESAHSMLSRLFSGGEGAVVLEPLETRPGPGEDLDVVRFALQERSGEAVPRGNYTVVVLWGSEPIGRKFFVVG